MSFVGKVAIITGSSSGIGREAAAVLGAGGASVTIHGQSADRLNDTVEYLIKEGIPKERIHSVRGAIENPATREALVNETLKKFGRIDILVNNAGISHKPGNDPADYNNLDYVMDVNFKSLIALSQLCAPHLEKTNGNIVNVSSIGADIVRVNNQPYVISKAALDHYTRNASVDYAARGIRVNTVSPGMTETNFAKRHGMSQELWETLVSSIAEESVPMKRSGTSREVANVIEFLASDKASYLTGSKIVVDGGMLAASGMKDPKLNFEMK